MMGRAYSTWLLVAILALVPARAQQPDDEEATMREAEQILSRRQAHETRWIDPLVRAIIPKDSTWYFKENNPELTFLMRNPTSLLAIRNVSCAALTISIAACEAPLGPGLTDRINFEETDAIRHFIFAAGIACRGEEFAKVYTTLHEGDKPREWSDAEIMDFKNNQVGIAWSRARSCFNGFRDEQLVRAALTALKEGKLKTIEKGTTKCTDPDALLKRGFPDLFERRRNAHEYMKKQGFNC